MGPRPKQRSHAIYVGTVQGRSITDYPRGPPRRAVWGKRALGASFSASASLRPPRARRTAGPAEGPQGRIIIIIMYIYIYIYTHICVLLLLLLLLLVSLRSTYRGHAAGTTRAGTAPTPRDQQTEAMSEVKPLKGLSPVSTGHYRCSPISRVYNMALNRFSTVVTGVHRFISSPLESLPPFVWLLYSYLYGRFH